MTDSLPAGQFLSRHEQFLLLDIRSPSEYAKGHIPGAHNLPLFSDQERAEVGTSYHRESRQAAFLLGLEFVGPKLAEFVRQATALGASERPLGLYCARGGARSSSMGWLLSSAGFQVTLLEGGYKAFREVLRESFEEKQEMLVLSGATGSGKTRLLHALAEQGEQVLDLEGLAAHRGSVFGGFAQSPDFSNEQFWNDVWDRWMTFDRQQRVWVEDEPKNLGRVTVPPGLFTQMRQCPVLILDIPQEPRLDLLLEEYGGFEQEFLARAIERIKKRLGPLNYKACCEALDAGDHREVARLCLDYYDKAYRYGLDKRDQATLTRMRLPGTETASNLTALLSFGPEMVPTTTK